MEYQKVDGELRKIEQELASSEERKKATQAKNFVKSAESRIAAQDARARELKSLRDELIARVAEMSKAISEYAEIDELVEGGGDISFYKRNAQQLLEKLRAAKTELNRLLTEIENLSQEYKKLMEQGKAASKLYRENFEKFKGLQAARAAEMEAINKRLEKIAATIPPELLERYKQKRKEHIYPVLVPLQGNMCVCGMDFPLAQRGKLAGGNIIECDNCHRIIYKV